METCWKKGPWRCNYIKMRPYWIRVSPKSIGAAQKSDTTEHTHTHTHTLNLRSGKITHKRTNTDKKALGKHWKRLEWCSHRPRKAWRWLSGKESACQCSSCDFSLWDRKIPWRRKWQPTPVFLPGKFHGQRSLAKLQSMGSQRVGHYWETCKEEKDSSLETSEETQWCQNLDLGHLASKNVIINSFILRHPSWGPLLHHP